MGGLPGSGIKPGSPALAGGFLDHWATREALKAVFLNACVMYRLLWLCPSQNFVFFFFMLSDTCVCFILFLNFVPCCTACGLFVPQPGLKPMCPKLEAQSLDRWTAREAPVCFNSLLTFSSASLLSFPEVSEQLNDCCFKLSWVNYLSQFL